MAAGSGNAAIPAARAGASVVACDLTPELLEAGQREAARLGVNLRWQPGDAENLPFGDGDFDTVLSCLGVMFAPYHQASADELIRVCRPGGTIGLLNWTPEGFIGQLFATMRPYAPPPPPGAQPPPLWGREDHVRSLLGDQVTDVRARRQSVRVGLFGQPEDFRDYFKTRYGPTIAAYRAIGADPERTAALDAELADLARRHDRSAQRYGEHGHGVGVPAAHGAQARVRERAGHGMGGQAAAVPDIRVTLLGRFAVTVGGVTGRRRRLDAASRRRRSGEGPGPGHSTPNGAWRDLHRLGRRREQLPGRCSSRVAERQA